MRVRVPFALAVVVSLLSLGGSGCAAAEAPEGLDNLSRFLFDRFLPAEGLEASSQEAEIRDAVSKSPTSSPPKALTSTRPSPAR